jgi:hypothetical protein
MLSQSLLHLGRIGMNRLILVLMLVTVITSCVKVQYIEKETRVIEYIEKEVIVFDSVPPEYLNPLFWQRFWEVHWVKYHAVTICYGRFGALTQFSPYLARELYQSIYNHEMTHQKQIKRWGCDGLQSKSSTALGLLEVELEAFRSENIVGGELIDRLMRYELIATLGRDSLKVLVKEPVNDTIRKF